MRNRCRKILGPCGFDALEGRGRSEPTQTVVKLVPGVRFAHSSRSTKERRVSNVIAASLSLACETLALYVSRRFPRARSNPCISHLHAPPFPARATTTTGRHSFGRDEHARAARRPGGLPTVHPPGPIPAAPPQQAQVFLLRGSAAADGYIAGEIF